MSAMDKLFVSTVLLCCVFDGCLFKHIPSYITPCKRDQNTIDTCARTAIEDLRPHLIKGIPELEVPSIDPFYIPEVRPTPGGELSSLKAYGKDIKVTGGGNFRIKSLSVDLDTFTIRAHVKFPKLHFEGRYKVDTVVLVVPVKGEGNLIADAIKCDAQIVLQSKVEERDGKEYIKFTKMDFDVSVKDYNIRLEGLFNGDKTLGEATNQALNQNKGEFLRAMKPNLEKGLARLLKDAANKITADVPLDELLPKV